MLALLDDEIRLSPKLVSRLSVLMLLASVACVAIAPLLMPVSYSPVEHAVSESAAQGVEGAWLARLGFLFLGFGVLLVANISGRGWGVAGRVFHRIYAIAMIAAATFAHMPWEDVSYDSFEDLLHSVAASTMGLGFTVGVLIVAMRRGHNEVFANLFDGVAILAALAISILMFNVAGVAGLLQRVMFGIGYAWFAAEAIRAGRRVELPRSEDEERSVGHAVGAR